MGAGGKGNLAILGRGLISGSNFIISILLARWLMPDQYGAYGGSVWHLDHAVAGLSVVGAGAHGSFWRLDFSHQPARLSAIAAVDSCCTLRHNLRCSGDL